MAVIRTGEASSIPLTINPQGVKLLLGLPADGSMDLYASCMIGIPQSRVAKARVAVIRRLFELKGGEPA